MRVVISTGFVGSGGTNGTNGTGGLGNAAFPVKHLMIQPKMATTTVTGWNL
jgi:hypothetical protein